MSQENVDLVLGLYPPPGEDYVQLFGNDSLWTSTTECSCSIAIADTAREAHWR